MARLPDSTALGGPPDFISRRPIASYDVSGYAQGAEAFGRSAAAAAGIKEQGAQALAKGFGAVGTGIESAGHFVAAAAVRQQNETDQLEIARARSDFLVNKVNLDASLQNDTDHATLSDRYSKSITGIAETAASRISNPRTREMFSLGIADDVARGVKSAGMQAKTLWEKATVGDASNRLEALKDSALKATDPVERTRIIDNGNAIIDSLVANKVLTPEDAVAQKRKWTSKYSEAALSALPAAERVTALSGFQGALAARESSGRPTLVNDFGYAGLYQFGAPRLADLGLYRPGPNENLDTWSKTPTGAGGKWSGTFSIPGHPDVRTLQDFLQSTSAQRAAFGANDARMEQEINRNGLGRYVGQTLPDGTPITREGIKAMMHLGGLGGARAVLEGRGDPADAYGTRVSSYAKLGLQSANSRVAQFLPEQDRQRMLEYAQGELLQGDRQHRLALEQAKEASDQTESAIFARIHTDDGSLSLVDDILKNPTLTREAKQRMTQQYESRGKDHPEQLYGKDFYSVYQRVHLPDGDPNKITDPSTAYTMVTRGGGLTPSGADRIVNEIRGKKTAEGDAEKQLMAQFFKNARGQISGTNEGMGIRDPKGEELFQRFQVQAFQAYDAGRKEGKSAYELLDPASKDYVGKSIGQFKRPTSEWFSDMISEGATPSAPATPAFDPNSVSTADDLVAAYQAGRVDRATAQRIALERGWAVRKTAVPPPAAIPSSLPQAPMSQ